MERRARRPLKARKSHVYGGAPTSRIQSERSRQVEEVAARLLAAEDEYAELAQRGTPVLTIYLNEDYVPLKRYMGVRHRELATSTPAQDRYAVDLGVAMLVLHQARDARVKQGATVDESLLETARHAAAQGALSILPQFDELVRQAVGDS